jgi:hypothetical protein
MMSRDMQHVYDTMVKPKENTLKADMFHPEMCVDVWHQDGTTYHFACAFAELYRYAEQEYLAVYTEHNGYHLFSVDDLLEECYGGYRYYAIAQYPPVRVGVV